MQLSAWRCCGILQSTGFPQIRELTNRTRVFVVSVGRESFRDGAALTQRRGKITLNPLDKALERPISTFSDTQNAPSAERARLRCLLARRRAKAAFLPGRRRKVCTGTQKTKKKRPPFY